MILNYGNVSIECRDGSDSDFIVCDEIFTENVYRVHNNMIIDSCVILDIGANIGAFTLDIAKRANENNRPVRIIAVEPEENNLKILRENIYRNKPLIGDSLIEIVENAVADEPKITHITNEHGGSTLSNEGQEVVAITLDHLFETYHIDQVDLMKIDIETAEVMLFDGASDEILFKCKRIVVEWDKECGLDNFVRIIKRLSTRCSFSTLGVPADSCYLYIERHK